MPRQARQLAESGIYHVMLRGVNRDAIFLEDDDYERFLRTLRLVSEASGCTVLAYCLMSNHIHLVVRALQEPIGAVIKRLGVRYAGWFNSKYGRVGHLFQDRFKSQPVEDDSYLVTLLRYVWNNPIEAGLVQRPEDYRWSSRRLLGLKSAIVDESELRRLLPPGGLDQLSAESMPLPADKSVLLERPTRHSDDQVAELLRRACGAATPAAFASLAASVQGQSVLGEAIRELRIRSATYAQIAKATGMSVSSVRRAHIAGQNPPVREIA